MIRIIDISFFANDSNSIAELIQQHAPALAYTNHIKQHADIQVIKHLNSEETVTQEGIKYSGFKSNGRFLYVSPRTLAYIKSQEPDVVILQGLIFPFQAIRLRQVLGSRTIVLVQHHGERPFGGIRKCVQRIADRSITGYLFTAVDNAGPWLESGIIKRKEKCFELLEASTQFKKTGRVAAKRSLFFTGYHNFLWVGRLNTGKDPLTVIKAFEKFIEEQPAARLYMIYQTDELLPAIQKIMNQNIALKDHIVLKGKLPHHQLEQWYNAADYYISGSHFEGSGYALLEAMACGCIPIVTDIPSFKMISDNGRYAILYKAGNVSELLEKIYSLKGIEKDKMSMDVTDHFNQNLSFRSIGDQLLRICAKLMGK